MLVKHGENAGLKMRYGVRAKIIWSVILLVTALTVVFAAVSIQQNAEATKADLLQRGVNSVLVLAKDSELGVFTENEEFMREGLSTVEGEQDYVFASLYDIRGQALVKSEKKASISGMETLPVGIRYDLRAGAGYIIREQTMEGALGFVFYAPVVAQGSDSNDAMFMEETHAQLENTDGGSIIGYVSLGFSTKRLDVQVNRGIQTAVTIFALFLPLAFFITYFSARRITEPLEKLVGLSNAVAQGDFSRSIDINRHDEVGELATALNKMVAAVKERNLALRQARDDLEKKVEERTAELKITNNTLLSSLDELRQAQDQLVQSGKMAALGELVAGVAHEINTPLGIGVTAASHLEIKVRDHSKRYHNNQLTRSEFEAFLRTALDSSNMVLANLNRAAEMVRSFKQVAVDQSDQEMRDFNVKSYFEEIFRNLQPELKRTKHEVTIHCQEGLVVTGYPGVLYQIVTNLVMNSLIHGFEGIESGRIQLDIRLEEENLKLRYSDNGCGISEKHLAKIFDPFFTTRRGQGGSGLGMHIVYNLVTQNLGGKIECKSTEGKGVTFYLSIPVIHQRAEAG